jgi:hypothetical protein
MAIGNFFNEMFLQAHYPLIPSSPTVAFSVAKQKKIAPYEPFSVTVRPKSVGARKQAPKPEGEDQMRKFSKKATALGVAVAMAAVTAVSVEPAAAFGGFHGGGFHGGWGHGGWGLGGGFHGAGWGHHGWGWGGGYYGGYDGGCYLRQHVDEDGGVLLRRVCY